MKKILSLVLVVGSMMFSGVLVAEPVLDFSKAEKTEVRHSMMGYRSTLVFYRLKDSQAILQILVDNKDESFPVTGKVHLFESKISDEGLKKWINNQHSDGLFTKVPKPVLTTGIPKESGVVVSRKETGVSKNPGPENEKFRDFEIKLAIKAFEIEGKFTVPAFADTVRVHVRKK